MDYGSTTIVMQLVDLNSGRLIDQVKTVNGQTAYGTDILTRITYSLEEPSHMDDLQRATAETFNSLLSQLSESMYCMQFDSVPDFPVRMQAAKFLPYTDIRRFPTIKDRLPLRNGGAI